MTYDLYIGDRSFSSWSLRGWLMFRAFELPVNIHMMGLYGPHFKLDMAALPLARTVPVMRLADGTILQDTLAMAETLHENHPDAGLWPHIASHRAFARWITAEMHSGFSNLRSDCPMDLTSCYGDFAPSDAVMADISRIEELWEAAFDLSKDQPEDWLLGAYSLADVFYAPIATRIAGYGLPVGDAAAAYINRQLTHPLMRQWRAMGATKSYEPHPYRLDLTLLNWPAPTPIPAKTVEHGPSENALCPYSQKPVTDFMEIGGRIFGFCNPFCRDKTVADPAAWPAFMEIYNSLTSLP